MPKQKLFDDNSDSEEEVALKTENVYAKKYDAWREKEELHKLEQKYGDKALNSDASLSSDSEDESDEPPEVNEEMETQFLKTLSLLKTKDPRIYDPQFKFFENDGSKEIEQKPKIKSLTFADSDEDDDDDGNIFKVEKKAEINDQDKEPEPSTSRKTTNEGKLKDYLVGKTKHIDDPIECDLAPLKALWSDPKLSDGEAFLRDYILNKQYLDDGDIGDAEDKVRDDEDLEADEKLVEEQGKFERAYNFRFEEPDDEYLKRFPRTMNFIRPKDDRRSRKRAEIRERKEEEKRKKMEEIARLKALKLKEIHEKIAKIKEVTGNEELAFKDDDIEGEFDPEEHDRRMRAIFDEQYYGEVDDEKPVFPDLDEELEIENWEKYEVDQQQDVSQEDASELHCEDEDFNMDADYDPKQARANLLEEMKRNLTGKKPRHRKKKSKLQQILAIDKPKFVPTVADKTYAQYMEEYYKMDCEDVIGGDLPTRFKYREVVPNDYGLTIEEILLADDKELTQWVPLKKIIRHRPENVEKGEVKTYAQRAKDEALKKKVLPSLFKELPEEPELVVPVETSKKKKKKKNKVKSNKAEAVNSLEKDQNNAVEIDDEGTSAKKSKKKKRNITDESIETIPDVVVKEVNDGESDNNKKKKNKNKNKSNVAAEETEAIVKETLTESKEIKKKHDDVHTEDKGLRAKNRSLDGNSKKKKKKHKSDGFVVNNVGSSERNVEQKQNASESNNKQQSTDNNKQNNNLKRKLDSENNVPSKKMKKNKNKLNNSNSKSNQNNNNKNKFKSKDKKRDLTSENPLNKLSDERLKAYGLNPKKYRSFLKYKKF